jgi:proline iminopeptidase
MSLKRRLVRVVGRLLLVLTLAGIGYAVFAAVVYNRPRPADLPCRGCTGDARSVSVDGFDLYVRELGAENAGVPIVILHGGPGHSSDSFRRSLDFLAADHRVLYYDQRGSGHSQILADPSLYTIELLVDELEALRRDVIGADRIFLIAHSAGGALAQRYAIAHSEHVEKLILISSISINNGVAAPPLWDALGPALFVLGAGVPPSDPLESNAWFAQVMVETSVGRLHDPANRRLLEESGPISFATWREVSRSLEGDDYREELSRLGMGTLAIYGLADGGTTGQEAAAGICEVIPHCRLAGFERSGHWPFLEEPELFAEVVSDFLAAP